MRHLLSFVIAVGAFALPAGPAPAQSVQPPPGFKAIFNGRDLDGWYGWAIHEKDADPKTVAGLSVDDRAKKIAAWTDDAKKHWSVQNGELVNDGHGAYLATTKDYGDIELLIEYKTVPKADSGIYLRASPQVQIWDHTNQSQFRNGADKGSGGLFNNSRGAPGKDPLVLADKPFGEWNKFRIIQVGERTTVYFNDKLVVDHARMENYWEKDRKNPLFRTGPILLQTHGGEIRWRNMFVREIPPAEANDILLKHNNEGFRDLFNGKDFTGWTGPVENYEVKDGAIVCKPRKGGNIHTKDEFSDFVARVEYKLPPGGNNGLLLRYPGTKDGAYEGLCEIQVLDDTDPKYAKLDPRQYNGSVYGMVAAKRGYLRPLGEWNFYEVTVKGPTIKVELNGTVIVDTDVSKVTEFHGNRPHPGKDRTSGYFGFAGHNDPVAFRTVKIKSLN
jgi:3-keto-disaccharide hydrolase